MIKNLLIIMTLSMVFSITAITESPLNSYAKKYNKENCEKHNGEWIEEECDL
jgi:hypothetical protein